MPSFRRVLEHLEVICDEPHPYQWPRSPNKMIFDAVRRCHLEPLTEKEWKEDKSNGECESVLWKYYKHLCGGDDAYSAVCAQQTDTDVVAMMKKVVEAYR